MKGQPIRYSAEELDFIRSVSTWPRAEAYAAFCQRFGRDDVTLQNYHALCKRKGWRTGRNGQFSKGLQPHNKGKKCEPGKGGNHPNARRTQFVKGERRGVAIKLYQPIGTERIAKDGYIQRKVNDGLPLQKRWRGVHIINWEAANGPLPKGWALKCLDGNKANTDASNWEAIPRAVLARLNGGRFKKTIPFDEAAPELKPAIMAVAKLKQKVSEVRA